MTVALASVTPPASFVHRLERSPEPFASPDWAYAHEDGTFGNRFDDPRGPDGVPPEQRFRVIYCATQRLAAFGETLARFRPSLALLARLAEIDDDEPIAESLAGAVDPAHPRRGLVKADWRLRRRVNTTMLDPGLRFVDIASPAAMQHLRAHLASLAVELGIREIDLSSLTGEQRVFTQRCALHVHDQADAHGRPRFAGIRYVSRLNPAWECWAVFDQRLRHAPGQPGFPQNILADDPDLLAVAHQFELTVEIVSGSTLLLRP
jgi:hypothetical protein